MKEFELQGQWLKSTVNNGPSDWVNIKFINEIIQYNHVTDRPWLIGIADNISFRMTEEDFSEFRKYIDF